MLCPVCVLCPCACCVSVCVCVRAIIVSCCGCAVAVIAVGTIGVVRGLGRYEHAGLDVARSFQTFVDAHSTNNGAHCRTDLAVSFATSRIGVSTVPPQQGATTGASALPVVATPTSETPHHDNAGVGQAGEGARGGGGGGDIGGSAANTSPAATSPMRRNPRRQANRCGHCQIATVNLRWVFIDKCVRFRAVLCCAVCRRLCFCFCLDGCIRELSLIHI